MSGDIDYRYFIQNLKKQLIVALGGVGIQPGPRSCWLSCWFVPQGFRIISNLFQELSSDFGSYLQSVHNGWLNPSVLPYDFYTSWLFSGAVPSQPPTILWVHRSPSHWSFVDMRLILQLQSIFNFDIWVGSPAAWSWHWGQSSKLLQPIYSDFVGFGTSNCNFCCRQVQFTISFFRVNESSRCGRRLITTFRLWVGHWGGRALLFLEQKCGIWAKCLSNLSSRGLCCSSWCRFLLRGWG